jgi:uncharacterized membrane protein YkgB
MKSRALLGRSSDPLFLFGGQRYRPISMAPFVAVAPFVGYLYMKEHRRVFPYDRAAARTGTHETAQPALSGR